jgi:multiple sugar transport system ATP-binding protein
MAGVTLDHVTKRFGPVEAVRDLTLTIQDREFLILVGPSGCGKSTALRMVAGLEEVTEGKIFIGERLVNDVPPKDRDIAMVFQSYALYPHMTVFDNMAFSLKLRHVPKPEILRRVKEAAQILGIEMLLARKPKQLSGGQRQRVALGRAIVRQPKAFLMDEPLSNLDAKLRVQTRVELLKLHNRLQTTFIYVTHDQVEAMTMGDRIVVLRDGVAQQVDTPQNLYDKPTNIFVAGFIGSPGMNFVSAQLSHENGVSALAGEGFKTRFEGDAAARARQLPAGPVIFGIRPEDIHGGGRADGQSVPAKIDVVEEMGSEKYAYLNIGQKSFTARFPPDLPARQGDNIGVVFDLRHAHLFDPKTEQAIL